MHPTGTLYDTDFYQWTQEQAALLREGALSDLDVMNLAEELESLGKRDRRELNSRLQTLVMHLLKWRHQPSARSGNWRGTIRTARREIAAVLADSPSLRRHVPPILMSGYHEARLDASDETGLPLASFPATCPWSEREVLDPDFFPEP
jgi:hypothetical protein